MPFTTVKERKMVATVEERIDPEDAVRRTVASGRMRCRREQ
jgi:hypothetical protein